MQIHGPAHLHGPQSISAPHRTQAPYASPESASRPSTVDQLDISSQADLVSRARETPDIRADRVANIRAAIAAGVYETDDKLNVALSRLFDEIG